MRRNADLTCLIVGCLLMFSFCARAQFAPTDLPGCTLWLAADDVDGDGDKTDNPPDGTLVSDWLDGSGNADHARVSNHPAGDAPAYVANAFNGRPSLRFNSSEGHNLPLTKTARPESHTVFVVGKRNTGNFYSWGWTFRVAGEYQVRDTSWTHHSIPFGADNSFHVYSGMRDDSTGTQTAWLDGSVAGTASWSGNIQNHTASTDPHAIGCGHGYNTANFYGDYFLNGDISEVIFYERALSDAERIEVEAYLQKKWFAPPLIPSWSSVGVYGITDSSAVLTGALGGSDADVYFVWDVDDGGTVLADWGNTNQPADLFLDTPVDTTVEYTVTNLAVGMTYHYRLFATNRVNGAYQWTPAMQFTTRLSSNMFSVVPGVYTPAFRNPLKGFRPGKSLALTHEYGTLCHWYVPWNAIENDESDNIQKIRDYFDAQWADLPSHNVRAVPRVYLEWPNVGTYWPADMTTGDYSSSQFTQRVARLVARLGEVWDNDPRVAYVEMGLIGFWGEHHSPAPTAEIQTLLTGAFTNAFRNKLVMIRHPWSEFRSYPFGGHWDSWAHWNQINHRNGMRSLGTRWHTAVNGGECAYNWGDYQIQPGDSPDDTLADPNHREYLLDSIRELHCNHLGWVSDYTAGSPAVAAGAAEVQKALGYRFVVTQLAYPGRVEADGQLQLIFSVVNTGSSPFYYDWPVEFSLLNVETGEPVWKTVLDSVDIRNWHPGDNWDDVNDMYLSPPVTNIVHLDLTMPGTARLPEGEYIVALSILEPVGMGPSVRFAIENHYSGGIHPFGKIGVGVDVAGDHTLDAGTFDDLRSDAILPYAMTPPPPPTPAVITQISVLNDDVTVEAVDSGSNRFRVIQRARDLASGEWQAAHVFPSTGTLYQWSEAITNDDRQVYYRIITE